MALIKERLGHVAASHPKQFSILPGFFAFSLNFVGVKEEGLLLWRPNTCLTIRAQYLHCSSDIKAGGGIKSQLISSNVS